MDGRRAVLVGSALLALLSAIAFAPVWNNDFINYDDPIYITDNPTVKSGLTADGIVWAMKSGRTGNWHPLTWMSHMIDVDLYGLEPRGHHLTSWFFHTLSGLLLFLILGMQTCAWRSSFLVALLFLVHPLRVESVAWAAERKDVLSTFFGVLSIGAYFRWTAHRGLARYSVLAIVFMLSLMSKPMLVTLPFVFLLLDYWPLGRFGSERNPRPIYRPPFALVREKIPLFAITLAVSVIVFFVQQHQGAVRTMGEIPLGSRLGNVFVSYLVYVWKTLIPTGLGVFYPHPEHRISELGVVTGLVGVLVTTFVLLRHSRRWPQAVVGWFWFLGTLVPVIGLIQAGGHAYADRFTYFPQIGLGFLALWHLGTLKPTSRLWGGIAFAVSILVLLTFQQTARWHDSATLFRHTAEVTTRNHLAFNQLGVALDTAGREDDAKESFLKALKFRPGYRSAQRNLDSLGDDVADTASVITRYQADLAKDPESAEAHFNLSRVLIRAEDWQAAERHLREAARLRPGFASAETQLGRALDEQGREDEALVFFDAAARSDPRDPVARFNYANALHRARRPTLALREVDATLELDPTRQSAHQLRGILLSSLGRHESAAESYLEVLKLNPDHVEAHYYRAVSLTLAKRGAEAVDHYHRVIELRPGHAEAHFNLAVVHMHASQPDEARMHLQRVLEIEPGNENAARYLAELN